MVWDVMGDGRGLTETGNDKRWKALAVGDPGEDVGRQKLAPGVSRLAKEGNQHDRANKVLQPPYEGSRAMLDNIKPEKTRASRKPKTNS
jgi:hypothetical protein